MVYILPVEKKHLADKALEYIRNHQRHELGYIMEQQVRELRKEATLCHKTEIQVGKSYGTFGLSPFANAWRDGVLQRNHGEVYIYLHTYLADGKLHAQSAWGGDLVTAVKPDMLLVEV